MRDNALSVYISKEKAKERPLERLANLARRKDRSVNHLMVQAILEYLDRQEQKR